MVSVDETPQQRSKDACKSTWHNIVYDPVEQECRNNTEQVNMHMASTKRRRGAKGFASMDDETKKRVASQGGLASARGKKTSNRGFASMDKDKVKEISSRGGKASKGSKGPVTERDEKDAESDDIIRVKDTSPDDLSSSLEDEDEREYSEETRESLSYSETDEDEDEGLGDGNLGRSTRGDVLGK